MNLFKRPDPTRHTLDGDVSVVPGPFGPPPETPEQAATVDPQRMKTMAAELDTLGLPENLWWRWDRGSFVSTGRVDGTAAIVGNTLGNWRLVRIGPGGKPMPEPVASARAALDALPKP